MLQGMVQSAEYIYNELKSENLLSLAYNHRPEAGTHKFPVVCTGHSLGGGTAAILTILLRDREVPDVTCFAFSPPGEMKRHNLETTTIQLIQKQPPTLIMIEMELNRFLTFVM